MPEELWMKVHNIVQEAVTKTTPKEKRCKEAKELSEEALKRAERRDVKGKGEKEKYTQLNAEFQRIAWRIKKSFFTEQCKVIEESKRWVRLEISPRKLRLPRENSMQKRAQ